MIVTWYSFFYHLLLLLFVKMYAVISIWFQKQIILPWLTLWLTVNQMLSRQNSWCCLLWMSMFSEVEVLIWDPVYCITVKLVFWVCYRHFSHLYGQSRLLCSGLSVWYCNILGLLLYNPIQSSKIWLAQLEPLCPHQTTIYYIQTSRPHIPVKSQS